MFRRCAVVCAVAVACLVYAAPAAAVAPRLAPTRYVSDVAGFQAAVAALRSTGGRIVLRPHLYALPMTVGPNRRGFLTITGSRYARVRSLHLDHTANVAVMNITIAPINADATLHAENASHIILDHLWVTAYATLHRVSVNLDHSNYVAVRNSQFAHCGDRDPDWALCLLPYYANHVSIYDNNFHDCRGCDFIHGRFGTGAVIRDNHFARALSCQYTWVKCGHQDLIELFAANNLQVTRNYFGVTQRGGAQLYISEASDHVRITNNVFRGTDPLAPGVSPRVGILIGTRIATRLPRDVEIINNTVLSGKLKFGIHNPSSIVLSTRYARLLPINRPLIANNILAHQEAPTVTCAQARRTSHNLIVVGVGCSETDVVGPALLDDSARPTAESSLVINQADPTLAPPRDFTYWPRGASPDVGAYEFH
jgi:hypothetical protein